MALLNIRPTDRYERFLARMAGDGSVPMPIPRDKKEKFLKAIAENINRGGSGGSGASAYDVAIENGFEGTEAEWLESLKGGNDPTDIDFTSDAPIEDDDPTTDINFNTFN